MSTDGSPDPSYSSCLCVIAKLASVSEELTQFSVRLRNHHRLCSAKNITEFRVFESGWRFQKWIEASLNESLGKSVVWMFELSESRGHFLIQTSITVENSDFEIELEIVESDSLKQLEMNLIKSARRLIQEITSNANLRKAIKTAAEGRCANLE